MGNKTSQYDQYYNQVTLALDPYRVLGLSQNFTWDELKAAYRRISIQVHPDKGGSAELFSAVTDCFRNLAMELKAREANVNHHERRRQAQEYFEREAEEVERFKQTTLPPPTKTNDEKTNKANEANEAREADDDDYNLSETSDFQAKFNRIFEKNKIDDEGHSFGYGDRMERSSAVREDFKMAKKINAQKHNKFDGDKFNRDFEERVQPSAAADVVVYREPEALPMSKRLQFTELGAERPGDYTKSEESDSHSLKYTDYMKAHTTERLVDPRSIKVRKEYKSVEAYQHDRDRVLKKKQTEDEHRFVAEREQAATRAEEDRLRRVADFDQRVARQYDRVNGKLIR